MSSKIVEIAAVAEIIAAVGGKDNILAATHCITRLRLVLKDEKLADIQKLNNHPLVKGVFSANGQLQIVIGQGTVDSVCELLQQQTGIGHASKEEVAAVSSQKMSILQRGIKMLADIFIPLLPAIVTAGLLMGLNNILTEKLWLDHTQSLVTLYPQLGGIAQMVNVIASTAFVFLPGLVGWSAVRSFGGNPLLGIVLGLMLIHPDLLNAWGYAAALESHSVPQWHIFGLTLEKVGYQGQVLPVIVSAYVLTRLEKWLNKRVADAYKLLVVAPIALLITGFLSFMVIGPVTFAIANGLTGGILFIFNKFALLGGLIFGAGYAPIVITGLHQSFLAIDFQLIASTGGALIWPMVALSNISQGSAALAVMVIAKDEKIKGLSLTSAISAYLGITEPAMFGVNLRFKIPFFCAMTGSAMAGALVAVEHVRASAIGVGGLPAFLSIMPQYWITYFMAMGIVLVVPFLLTIILAKKINFRSN